MKGIIALFSALIMATGMAVGLFALNDKKDELDQATKFQVQLQSEYNTFRMTAAAAQEELQQQLAVARSAKDSAEAQLAIQNQLLAAKDEQIKQLDSLIAERNGAISLLEGQILQLEIDADQNAAQLVAAQTALANAIAERDALLQEKTNLIAEKTSLIDQIVTLQSTVASMASDIEYLQKYRTDFIQLATTIDVAWEQIVWDGESDPEYEPGQLHEAVKLQQIIAKATFSIDERIALTNELSRLRDQIDNLNAQLQELTDQTAIIAALQQDVVDMQVDLAAANAMIESTQLTMTTLQTEIAQKQNRITELEEEALQTGISHAAEIAELQEDIIDLQADLALANATIESAELSISDLQNEIVQKQNRITELEAQLAQENADHLIALQNLQNEKEALQEEKANITLDLQLVRDELAIAQQGIFDAGIKIADYEEKLQDVSFSFEISINIQDPIFFQKAGLPSSTAPPNDFFYQVNYSGTNIFGKNITSSFYAPAAQFNNDPAVNNFGWWYLQTQGAFKIFTLYLHKSIKFIVRDIKCETITINSLIITNKSILNFNITNLIDVTSNLQTYKDVSLQSWKTKTQMELERYATIKILSEIDKSDSIYSPKTIIDSYLVGALQKVTYFSERYLKYYSYVDNTLLLNLYQTTFSDWLNYLDTVYGGGA